MAGVGAGVGVNSALQCDGVGVNSALVRWGWGSRHLGGGERLWGDDVASLKTIVFAGVFEPLLIPVGG